MVSTKQQTVWSPTRKMLIAGFDCGIKNLGVCFLSINENKIAEFSEIKKIISSLPREQTPIAEIFELVKKCVTALEKVFVVKKLDVMKLAESKASEIETTKALARCLHKLDEELERPDVVFIERQMSRNTKTNPLSAQILYHYISKGVNAELVGAGLKNAVSLSPEGRYGNFIATYQNYTANKKHAVFNMWTFLASIGQKNIVRLEHKQKEDDIADALMMILAKIATQN